jgi:TonB family protein
MGRIWMAGLAPLLVAVPSLAAEKAPVELAPTTPWNVHYADDYCRLARFFGEGKQRILLSMEQGQPGEGFRLTLSGAMLDGPGDKDEASLTFGDLGEQKLLFFPGTLGDKTPAWIFSGNIRIRPYSDADVRFAAKHGYYPEGAGSVSEAEEAATNSLLIARPLRNPVRLKTGPMKAAFAAMNSCTDELLEHWGIDAARHRERSRSAMPVGSPARWLNSSDYPSAMLARGQPGLVRFRLSVGADGVPTACHIQRSTNGKPFDDAVCKGVMRRARFEPALDKEGQPMASYYVNAVQFQF